VGFCWNLLESVAFDAPTDSILVGLTCVGEEGLLTLRTQRASSGLSVTSRPRMVIPWIFTFVDRWAITKLIGRDCGPRNQFAFGRFLG